MITLEDNRGNLLQGNIVVSDKEKLIDFRNQLLEETYEGKDANFEYVLHRTNLISFGTEETEGIYSKNGLLIRNFNFVPDYIDRSTCAYDFEREIIACRHLNTILLLSSLLSIPDRYYDTKIGLDFYKAGIFDVGSFEQAWMQYRNNLLNEDNYSDLEAFRNAFDCGSIKYDVHDSWLKEDIVRMNVLKKLNLDLNDVVANTRVLGVQKVLRPSRVK